MSNILFSTWQGEFIDNRNIADDEKKESSFKLPYQYNIDSSSKAFMFSESKW